MYDLSGSYIFMLKANENGMNMKKDRMNMKKDRRLRASRPFFFLNIPPYPLWLPSCEKPEGLLRARGVPTSGGGLRVSVPVPRR